jgi:hypothetical protein
MRGLAERWLTTVPAIKEIGLRATFVGGQIAACEVGTLAAALEDVCVLAEQADPRARDVLGAAASTLTDPSHDARLEELRVEAQARGYFALARLLRRKANASTLGAPDPSERVALDVRVGRPLTLGERKTLARGHDRFMLDRLLRDPHPLVIRNVLSNPRITEEDVVRLAARRPTYADVQSEIAKAVKWSVRPRVRIALVQNPYTPPGISVPLLALCVRPELDQVLAATDVPPIVRGAAFDLRDRRPPVPQRDDIPTTQ